ncbi:hypothetical protein AAA527_33280, partial [Pseudomonas aeruginosa]
CWQCAILMQGLAIFSAFIIELHGDFECISIRDPMLTGSKRPEAAAQANLRKQGKLTPHPLCCNPAQ